MAAEPGASAAPRFEFIGDIVNPSTPSAGVVVVSWNVLCKFGFNERFGFPYDGFNRRFESEADYLERLQRVADRIKGFAESHQPDVILIQENANACKGEFGSDALPRMLLPLQDKHYQILQDGEFLSLVRERSKKAFTLDLPPLHRMQGKVHAVRCPDLNVVILNVHLAFDKRGSENSKLNRQDLEAIRRFCNESYPGTSIILAGDTNRVSEQDRLDELAEVIEQLIDGLGILYMPPSPTNIRYDCKTGKSEFTYADFVADLTLHS
ncbi:unnamed protein product [Symbiodinium pilosum]|uniref:Endonuclease/exonuclease/phosphatase domain-containing protein n=1 Tax=Symbiodinium pilosum TaxID=2952 RepID=A0A812W423_SYMPI|nr:unnamed protein product [Symbiodinium pilosum]